MEWEKKIVKSLRAIGVDDHIPAIIHLYKLLLSQVQITPQDLHKLEQEARLKDRERILGIVEGMKKDLITYADEQDDEIKHIINEKERTINFGYNQALEDIKQKIKLIEEK